MRRIVISTSSSGLDNLKVNTKVNTKVDLIRLRMFINNVEFIDGKNITTKGLHQLMTGVSCSAIHTQPAPETEVLALFNDLLREFTALLCIPMFMRRYPSAAVGLGGATSLDFTLPIIQQSGGLKVVPLAISFGFIINIVSPVLMVGFSALG